MLAQEIQKHIQTYKATPNTETAFNTLYQNFQRLAETQVGNDVDQKDMLWFPHLSVRNNMMGNLFFPGELLSNDCSVYTLYFRGYIFLGLVFASKFGHPLAYHHLKKTLEMWIEDERIGESYWPLVERFQFKLNQIVNVCKDTINTRRGLRNLSALWSPVQLSVPKRAQTQSAQPRNQRVRPRPLHRMSGCST